MLWLWRRLAATAPKICRALNVIEGVLVKVLQRNRTNSVCAGGIMERDYGVPALMQKDWWLLCSGLKDSALPLLWHRLKL